MLFLGSWKTPQKTIIDPCRIYGAVYFSEKPAEADFVIFIESEESFADLIIFEESNLSFADTPGKWYEVSDPFLADFIIYKSSNISESDFTIAYTAAESFAGCQ